MFIVVFSIILFSSSLIFSTEGEEKHIVVLTASYSNKDWYQKNIDSVFMQKYSNYEVMYIDDCSPDGTYDLVVAHVAQLNMQDRFTITRNEEHKGAMYNQYMAIQQCKPSDIIVILDGDDWLASENVLSYINEIYKDPNIWLTYGQFIEYPTNHHGFCHMYPPYIVERNAFREFSDIPSHLRTFYAGLAQKVKKEDLMLGDNFFAMCADMAYMIPMIEMACDHFRFIPDILLIYNAQNSLNDYKVSKQLQRQIDLEIRRRPRYQKLESLFE